MSTLKVNQITDLNNAEIFEPNLMTAVSASGTSVDFTGIPSWVKRITVMFSGVSTSGTSPWLIQLGDSGGIETSGYVGGSGDRGGEGTSSAGLVVVRSPAAASAYSGVVTWQMLNSASFSWCAAGVISINASGQPNSIGGAKSLSDTLDRIRITTVNGTDTFDAGTINVMYE